MESATYLRLHIQRLLCLLGGAKATSGTNCAPVQSAGATSSQVLPCGCYQKEWSVHPTGNRPLLQPLTSHRG